MCAGFRESWAGQLLEREQGVIHRFSVAVRAMSRHIDHGLAPRRRHLAQRPAAHVFQLGRIADFLLKQCAQGRRSELRQNG